MTAEKLENIFGVPKEGIDTGFMVSFLGEIIKVKGCEKTGYRIGGPCQNTLMSTESKVIGYVCLDSTKRILAPNCKETAYFIGGPTGRSIMFRRYKEA